MRAVSSKVQFAGGAEENAKPGRDGTTTSNDTDLPVAVLAVCVSSFITAVSSRKEPGQP